MYINPSEFLKIFSLGPEEYFKRFYNQKLLHIKFGNKNYLKIENNLDKNFHSKPKGFGLSLVFVFYKIENLDINYFKDYFLFISKVEDCLDLWQDYISFKDFFADFTKKEKTLILFIQNATVDTFVVELYN